MFNSAQTYFFSAVALFIAAAAVDNSWSLGLGGAAVMCFIATYLVRL